MPGLPRSLFGESVIQNVRIPIGADVTYLIPFHHIDHARSHSEGMHISAISKTTRQNTIHRSNRSVHRSFSCSCVVVSEPGVLIIIS